MIHFFRKIRHKLADNNQFLKYSRYAIGEIALVMIGILLALQVNNWNEKRLAKLQEIIILKNIKNDLSQDSSDINFNLGMHKKTLVNEIKLLDFMMSNRIEPIDSINYTEALGYALILELHESTFSNIQNNDLGILTNNDLSRKIARYYDFYTEALLKLENGESKYNYFDYKKPFFQKHFKLVKKLFVLDSVKNITEDYYNPGLIKKKMEIVDIKKLKNDEAFKIELNESIFYSDFKIKYYLYHKMKLIELLSDINEELESFEN